MGTALRDPRIEDGVVRDARLRQRRRRAALTLAFLIAAFATAAVIGGRGATPPAAPLRPAGSPEPLGGAPLAAGTPLRLLVSENGGTVHLLDVARRRAHTLAGLTVPSAAGPQVTLAARAGGALATVDRYRCARCRGRAMYPDRRSTYAVSASGAVRRLHSITLAYHDEAIPARGSTAAWVLHWPHRGPCSLRLAPGGAPVRVPCGNLTADTSLGVWLWNANVLMIVDAASGHVRMRIRSDLAITPLRGDLVLESTAGAYPHHLALVNLLTGARRPLLWPSPLGFGYAVLPAPHGPLVAVDFADPAYPPPHGQQTNQAADLWILDTASASFTHVPGFPVLEYLKSSGIAWTPNGRLVVAAQSGGDAEPSRTHTTIGLWRPGQRAIHVATAPSLGGYTGLVALTRHR
jgi:hypothetical protein